MQWLLFPVAVLAGTLMVVQSGCNAMLENIIDRPIMVGVVSLSVGLTTLIIVGIATGELGFPNKAIHGPWWAWLGGICGAVSLLSQPIAAPRLGAGTYIGLFITASSVMSVICTLGNSGRTKPEFAAAPPASAQIQSPDSPHLPEGRRAGGIQPIQGGTSD